ISAFSSLALRAALPIYCRGNMSTVPYIKQLVTEAIKGLEDLCRGSIAASEVDPELLRAAVNSQVEIRGEHDFQRVPEACRDFLRSVERSCDRDLLVVASKILRSVRLAAYTHIVGKDAEYVDQALRLDI